MKTHPFWTAICLHIAAAFNSCVLGPGTGMVLPQSLLSRAAVVPTRVYAWYEPGGGLRHARRGAVSLVRRREATHRQSTSQYGDSEPKSTPVRGQALANGAETAELAATADALQRQLVELEGHLTQITKAVEAVCSLEQVQQLVQQRARDDDLRPRNAIAGPPVGTATLNASEEHPWIAAIADTGLDPSRFQAAKPDTVEQHTVRPPDRKYSSHWFKNVVSIPSSRTLQRIMGPLLANLAAACLVYMHSLLFPQSLQWLVSGLASSRVHNLASSALGLLLVFRTRSAYDRFVEARKMWSVMIAEDLLGAFAPILLQHLRAGRPKPSRPPKASQPLHALERLVGPSDALILWHSRNRPVTVCRMIAAIFKHAFTDVDRVLLHYPQAGRAGDKLTRIEVNIIMTNVKADRSLTDKCIHSLTKTISDCERIVKTSIPSAYSKHTSRFLSVWCFSLPLVLVEQLGWRMIPCVGVISWALLAIQEVGNIIEDPFNMPFLWRKGECHDELKLERSFANIRGDVLDASPATGQDSNSDYDVCAFHRACDYTAYVRGGALHQSGYL